jgi:YidC/Oxa1 family membrane protein insertase
MNDKPTFFDGKTLGAIAVVFLVWMGWQYYMQKKYPHVFNEVKKEDVVAPKEKEKTPEQTAPTPSAEPEKQAALDAGPAVVQAVKETVLSFDSPQLSFDISSQGMGLRNIRLNKYTDRQGNVIRLGTPDNKTSTFSTALIGQKQALPFELTKIDDHTFLGRAHVGNMEIVKKIEVSPSRYELKTDISVQGKNANFLGVATSVYEEVVPVEGHSFFTPQYERQEFYVDGNDTSERVHIAKEDLSKSFSKVRLASVGSQYFAQAFVNRSDILPELEIGVAQKTKRAMARIIYQSLENSKYSVEYSTFMGPKEASLLRAVDSDLDNVIDYGFFSWIAKYLLAFLKGIYSLVGNWGVAIILLTAAVRLLVLPFNMMSYRSMKVMQVLQPRMKAIREKYKDDQTKMNQEIMALMKTNKANPLGGCLPMLLQFPIFWALYQVLGHSIELYQAPFAFWIHDLSAKDPYYVLPVLMGATLFLQQKTTPNAMDPAQAKILMFMPLVFSFFMLSLPSGLTLYIFVSGIFGVLQQLYFLKYNQVATPA